MEIGIVVFQQGRSNFTRNAPKGSGVGCLFSHCGVEAISFDKAELVRDRIKRR
jgi:hypothetical protein